MLGRNPKGKAQTTEQPAALPGEGAARRFVPSLPYAGATFAVALGVASSATRYLSAPVAVGLLLASPRSKVSLTGAFNFFFKG